MIEKTMRINYLLDFYQSLLTDKQKDYMDLYYLNDLSLGEIAEQFGVSRQAVYDNIKRTESLLEEYENKLSLLEKFHARAVLLEELRLLEKNNPNQKRLALISQLSELE